MRALVVDDHPSLASAVARMLRTVGWETSTANTVLTAQAALRSTTFDVVVSDYHLEDGRLTGLDVLRAAHETSPATRLVLMSGGLEDASGVIADSGLDVTFLRKPFTATDLRGILGSPS